MPKGGSKMQEQLMPKYIIIHDKKLNKMFSIFSKNMVDMKTGKLSYTDDNLTWMGETYPREKGMINYNGEWLPEGSKVFPWEQH